MRPLDLLGMILTIIGANIILTTGTILITIPRPVYPPLKFFRVAVIVSLTIGALIIIIGIIIRIIDSIIKERESMSYSGQKYKKTEVEVVNEIIIFLKINKGKAFTINTLLNRIYKGDLTEIKHDIIEKLLQERVIKNVIRSQLKDAELFYFY